MPSQAVALLLFSLATLEPAAIRASLDVDASSLGDAGPFIDEQLTARGEVVLFEGEVLPATSPSDPIIHVRVEALDDVDGYRFSYEVTREGVLVEDTRGSAQCRLCTDTELAEQVDAAIGRLVQRLRPQVEPQTPPQAPPPVVVEKPSAPRWEVERMGGAGIVLTGAGGVALGLGIGLAIAQPLVSSGSDDRNSTVRVAGMGVAVAGAALLGTGVALMLIERGRSRRRTGSAQRATPWTLRF